MDYQEIRERHRAADHAADKHLDVTREIYRHFWPHRVEEFDEDPASTPAMMWASMPATMADESASRLQAGIAPLFQVWLKLSPPTSLGDAEKRMVARRFAELNTKLWKDLGRNFGDTFGQYLADGLNGIGAILIEDGGLDAPFLFQVEPMLNMRVEVGPNAEDTAMFRRRRRTMQQIRRRWPQWSPPHDMLQTKPEQEWTVWEGALRHQTDREERWTIIAWIGEEFSEADPRILEEREVTGAGSCPWVIFRWDRSPSSSWGFGPLYKLLSTARRMVHFAEKGAQGAARSVVGTYMADDDGVLNVDNITLGDGEIIPVSPNGNGIRPIPPAGRFDHWEFYTNKLEYEMTRGLFLDRLGAPEGTPMSATEVLERRQELARVINGPYNRITSMMDRIIRRLLWIKKDDPDYELPKVDGERVEVEMLGPFARDQRLEKAMSMVQFMGMIRDVFGEQMAPAIIEQFGTASDLADLMDFPAHRIRNPEQNQEATDAALQLLQRFQGLGGGGGGQPGPGGGGAGGSVPGPGVGAG